MQHFFEPAFYEICREIIENDLEEEEWMDVESPDMFQNHPYIGGFEAIENAFCFSVYVNGGEYWFQLPLSDVFLIANGVKKSIEIYPPLD